MKGGYTDNYYMQMAQNIRRYKGVRPIPQSSGYQKIRIDGTFKEWDKVKVEYSSVNQTDYTTTLVTTAYANGECPDILWVEPATFKKFSDAEMLADLSSYYTDDLKKDILPSFLEAASGDDGKIYTLPFECETLGLFYDADALEEEGIEPPKTWEELKSAAEKLTTKDRYGIVLPVEKTAYTLFNWWPFMWMDDADIYDADGNVTAGKDLISGVHFIRMNTARHHYRTDHGVLIMLQMASQLCRLAEHI